MNFTHDPQQKWQKPLESLYSHTYTHSVTLTLTLTRDEGLTLEGEPRMVGRGLLCMSSLRRGEEWRGRRAIMPP